MKKTEIISVMFELKKVLTRMLPKKTKDISISILCIQEIYEYMLFDKDTTRSFERLGVGLSNVLKLCQDSLKLAKKNTSPLTRLLKSWVLPL